MLDLSIRDFADALAAKTPTPGGGSAAAAAAAMGVGLLAMAARFSQGKKHEAEDAEDRLATAILALDRQREKLLPMVEGDAEAYGRVTEAYRLPKDDDAQRATRDATIQAALCAAMTVPEETIVAIRDALQSFEPALELIGRNIVSDVGAGTSLLEAASRMAALNVRINAAYVKDEQRVDEARRRVHDTRVQISALAKQNNARVDDLLAG